MLNVLLYNQLEKMLGRKPKTEESRSLRMFISENLDSDTTTVSDIVELINQWFDQTAVTCAWCGQKFLAADMYYHADNGEYFCDHICKKDWETEHGKCN